MTIEETKKKINEKLEKLEDMANRNMLEVELDKELINWFMKLENNSKLSLYRIYCENEPETYADLLSEDEDLTFN